MRHATFRRINALILRYYFTVCINLRFPQKIWHTFGGNRGFGGGGPRYCRRLDRRPGSKRRGPGQPQRPCRQHRRRTQAQARDHCARAMQFSAGARVCVGSASFRKPPAVRASALRLPIVVSTRRGLRGCLERVSGDLSGLGLGPELARAEASRLGISAEQAGLRDNYRGKVTQSLGRLDHSVTLPHPECGQLLSADLGVMHGHLWRAVA